jgi:hypothetical protein
VLARLAETSKSASHVNKKYEFNKEKVMKQVFMMLGIMIMLLFGYGCHDFDSAKFCQTYCKKRIPFATFVSDNPHRSFLTNDGKNCYCSVEISIRKEFPNGK